MVLVIDKDEENVTMALDSYKIVADHVSVFDDHYTIA